MTIPRPSRKSRGEQQGGPPISKSSSPSSGSWGGVLSCSPRTSYRPSHFDSSYKARLMDEVLH